MPRHSRPYLQGEHAAVELVELDGEPAAHSARTPASYHPHAATHGPAAHSVHAFRTPAHGDDSSYDHGSEQLVEPTSVAASNLHPNPNPYPSPHPYPNPYPYPATPYSPNPSPNPSPNQDAPRAGGAGAAAALPNGRAARVL